jgi:hypothetical protein
MSQENLNRAVELEEELAGAASQQEVTGVFDPLAPGLIRLNLPGHEV